MHRRSLLLAVAAAPAQLLAGDGGARASSLAAGVDGDLAIVRAAMAIHPGLYLHANPRAVAATLARFEADYQSAAMEADTAAAYLALSRFLATLRCGHSYANFFNQDDPRVTRLFDRPTRLPFWFRWVGPQMIVLRDPSPMALPRGSEILAINDLPAAQVLARLLPYTRGDGGNDAKRRSLLSVEGLETLESFDIFQGLLLPPTGGVHRLTVRLPSGAEVQRSCAPATLADRRAMMTRVAEDSDATRWTWQRRTDGVVVLTMPGWAMWNSKWDWRGWLADRLDSLADARGLVIDIRANEGGDDCGDPILARLIDRPISSSPFDVRLRFAAMPGLLRQHSSTWDNGFYTLGDGARPLGNGYFVPAAPETQSRITPAGRPIACPVAVLIGPVNSSATFAFINAVRATGKAMLIGETTGGNRRGINGGAFLFVKLPGSGIEFDLPLKGYVARTPQPDAGIAPDVPVAASITDIQAGTDRAIEVAVRHCLAWHHAEAPRLH